MTVKTHLIRPPEQVVLWPRHKVTVLLMFGLSTPPSPPTERWTSQIRVRCNPVCQFAMPGAGSNSEGQESMGWVQGGLTLQSPPTPPPEGASSFNTPMIFIYVAKTTLTGDPFITYLLSPLTSAMKCTKNFHAKTLISCHLARRQDCCLL